MAQGLLSDESMSLASLFGHDVPIGAIVDCRVTRASARGLTSVAVGSRPTWLKLTLADGRRLEAHSRGPGPEQDRIEAAIASINGAKIRETNATLARGGSVPFGELTLSVEGIHKGSSLTPWDHIAGWDVFAGELTILPLGASRWTIWLGKVAFADALCEIVATRLGADKRIQPSPPIFNLKIVLGLAAAAITVVALVYGVDYLQRRHQRAVYAALPRGGAIVDEAAPVLSDRAALARLPACPTVDPEYGTPLAASDKSSVRVFAGASGWKDADLDAIYPSTKKIFVWSREGSGVRIVAWDHEQKTALCTSVREPRAAYSPASLAGQAALGYPDAPTPSSSVSAAPTTSSPRPSSSGTKAPRSTSRSHR